MARTGFVWRRKEVIEIASTTCREYRWEPLRKTTYRYCYGIGKRVMRSRRDALIAEWWIARWINGYASVRI
jgi:hypothetical protein